MYKIRILFLILFCSGLVMSVYGQSARNRANQAFQKMRTCQDGCQNLECLKQAFNDYENIRKNNPNLNLQKVNLERKISAREKKCSNNLQASEGGVEINGVMEALLKSELEIDFIQIETSLKKAERDEILTQISELQERKLNANETELESIQTQENKLKNSFESVNNEIVKNEKEFKKQNSFKFKLTEKLYQLTQKLSNRN